VRHDASRLHTSPEENSVKARKQQDKDWREQQMSHGGVRCLLWGTHVRKGVARTLSYTQAAAHGTGARIPTADDTVVSMRLVTPGVGPITLDSNTEPELFSLAKAGLGALGVVTQVRQE
jgi:hypothetical protein